ncbi:hypothetical protein EFZ10_14380 [Tatumella sp. TA1]|uniref:hypothetical protein n=1 Tax=Rosenbergiella collisarenosi TaxID=1544695 RepID=UPI0008F814AD|nr:hypothetical protein [Rosenbergiella collisarenosi]MBT0721877.1 hypothetical protein [Rosenbergiella collisarenosi]QGX92703.1 hypothetical protein EFZ10_14380 [Tatumella sp. TA1]
MVDEQRFEQLLSAVSEAIRLQDWDKLILANQQLTFALRGPELSEHHRLQIRECYQAGLAECQQHADSLWLKIQKTLCEREAMAAYASFGDAESFSG